MPTTTNENETGLLIKLDDFQQLLQPSDNTAFQNSNGNFVDLLGDFIPENTEVDIQPPVIPTILNLDAQQLAVVNASGVFSLPSDFLYRAVKADDSTSKQFLEQNGFSVYGIDEGTEVYITQPGTPPFPITIGGYILLFLSNLELQNNLEDEPREDNSAQQAIEEVPIEDIPRGDTEPLNEAVPEHVDEDADLDEEIAESDGEEEVEEKEQDSNDNQRPEDLNIADANSAYIHTRLAFHGGANVQFAASSIDTNTHPDEVFYTSYIKSTIITWINAIADEWIQIRQMIGEDKVLANINPFEKLNNYLHSGDKDFAQLKELADAKKDCDELDDKTAEQITTQYENILDSYDIILNIIDGQTEILAKGYQAKFRPLTNDVKNVWVRSAILDHLIFLAQSKAPDHASLKNDLKKLGLRPELIKKLQQNLSDRIKEEALECKKAQELAQNINQEPPAQQHIPVQAPVPLNLEDEELEQQRARLAEIEEERLQREIAAIERVYEGAGAGQSGANGGLPIQDNNNVPNAQPPANNPPPANPQSQMDAATLITHLGFFVKLDFTSIVRCGDKPKGIIAIEKIISTQSLTPAQMIEKIKKECEWRRASFSLTNFFHQAFRGRSPFIAKLYDDIAKMDENNPESLSLVVKQLNVIKDFISLNAPALGVGQPGI